MPNPPTTDPRVIAARRFAATLPRARAMLRSPTPDPAALAAMTDDELAAATAAIGSSMRAHGDMVAAAYVVVLSDLAAGDLRWADDDTIAQLLTATRDA